MNATNQVTLIGNLGNDPNFFGSDDNPGARFDLATNEVFGSGDDRRQRTDWHRIICWGGLTSSATHLAKGDKVALAGRLRSNDFEDDDCGLGGALVRPWSIHFVPPSRGCSLP